MDNKEIIKHGVNLVGGLTTSYAIEKTIKGLAGEPTSIFGKVGIKLGSMFIGTFVADKVMNYISQAYVDPCLTACEGLAKGLKEDIDGTGEFTKGQFKQLSQEKVSDSNSEAAKGEN